MAMAIVMVVEVGLALMTVEGLGGDPGGENELPIAIEIACESAIYCFVDTGLKTGGFHLWRRSLSPARGEGQEWGGGPDGAL
jgi:hypothetical protein